jgi:hypothetical protein
LANIPVCKNTSKSLVRKGIGKYQLLTQSYCCTHQKFVDGHNTFFSQERSKSVTVNYRLRSFLQSFV